MGNFNLRWNSEQSIGYICYSYGTIVLHNTLHTHIKNILKQPSLSKWLWCRDQQHTLDGVEFLNKVIKKENS